MQQAGTKDGTQGVRARSRLVYGWPNLSFLELCGGREALPSQALDHSASMVKQKPDSRSPIHITLFGDLQDVTIGL